MKKWILTALLASLYISLAWGHNAQYSHTHQRDQSCTHCHHQKGKKQTQLNRINNYYLIHNHTHYDHGHSYPVCTQHGCNMPCGYHFQVCPLITANVVFPTIPAWFIANIQASFFYACQNQYQWCLWSTPFYLQGACTNQYFFCMGYTPTPYYY